jgi:hypothetical protein
MRISSCHDGEENNSVCEWGWLWNFFGGRIVADGQNVWLKKPIILASIDGYHTIFWSENEASLVFRISQDWRNN